MGQLPKFNTENENHSLPVVGGIFDQQWFPRIGIFFHKKVHIHVASINNVNLRNIGAHIAFNQWPAYQPKIYKETKEFP